MIQIPEHAPFTEAEREALSKMAAGWSAKQRLWLSTFLAGAVPSAGGGALQSNGSASLVVLYGTESGNSEALAERTAKLALARGFNARTRNMAESTPVELSKAENLLVVERGLVTIGQLIELIMFPAQATKSGKQDIVATNYLYY